MTLTRLTVYAIVLTAACAVFIAANGFSGGPIFWNLLWADLPPSWLMLVVLLIGHWYGGRRQLDSDWTEKILLSLEHKRYEVAAGLWVLLCAGSLLVYRNQPLSMDEYAAVFQANVFAAGEIHGNFPPELLDNLVPPPFQDNFLMVNRVTGAVMSAYWPGFSLLLTPFVWLGIPWACNPTIVALSFLLIGRMARDLLDSRLAVGWALLFSLASPAFVANGITYYSMPAHLLFNLGFAWLLLAPTPLRLFLAGLAGGFALSLHNPFPHAAFALPWIIWLATRRGQVWRNLFFLALGYLPMILMLSLGWLLWRQDVLREGEQAAVAAIGSVPASSIDRLAGMLRSFFHMLHWPGEQIIYARLGGLAKLWLWASPLLLLLAWWGGRGEKRPGIRLMGASALLTFFAYFLIEFDQGHGWGYRYFHSAWGVLPVLAALGVIKLAQTDYPRVLRQVAMLALASLVAANAMRFVQMGEFMQAHLAQFPPRVEAGRTIVLHNGRGYYALDLIQNDPWLRGETVVLLTSRPADKKYLARCMAKKLKIYSNRYGSTCVVENVFSGEGSIEH